MKYEWCEHMPKIPKDENLVTVVLKNNELSYDVLRVLGKEVGYCPICGEKRPAGDGL